LAVNGDITLLGGSNIRPKANSTTALNIADSTGTPFVTFNSTAKTMVLLNSLAVASGGTGATTAAGAKAALGVTDPALTATYVGFGGVSNAITGSSNLTYDGSYLKSNGYKTSSGVPGATDDITIVTILTYDGLGHINTIGFYTLHFENGLYKGKS
jgi:hypothetical protein